MRRANRLCSLSQPTRQFSQSPHLSSLPRAANSNPNPATATPPNPSSEPSRNNVRPNEKEPPEPEKGAMTLRLEQATEDALLSGGRAAARAVAEAGFSEELKARLLDKLTDTQFNNTHAAAFTEAGLNSGDTDTDGRIHVKINPAAGQGTRHIAASQPWTGEETPEDAVLRMLNDARKPLAPGLRGKVKIPEPTANVVVDMRMGGKNGTLNSGQRVASARDRAQAYAGLGLNEKGLSEEEREAMRREFRERFRPGARAMPNTVSGLAALANERIENAIARGQFKVSEKL